MKRDHIVVGFDVMGGDYGLPITIYAALLAARNGVCLVLFGRQAEIQKHLEQLDPLWASLSIEIVDCLDSIGMHESPVRSVMIYRDSSMVKMVQWLKSGRIDAAVSAGNSGAYVAAAVLYDGMLDMALKPALASFFPTVSGSSFLMLDLGATVDCRPEHLVSFARMGNAYVRACGLSENPRIALLSNGHESSKGSAAVKAAHEQLSKDPALNFIGNIESRDMLINPVDVVVADGFVGNAVLKTAQGVIKALVQLLHQESDASYRARIGLGIAKGSVKKIFKTFDYSNKGGAVALGMQHQMFFAHGSSDAIALANVLSHADASAKSGIFNRFINIFSSLAMIKNHGVEKII